MFSDLLLTHFSKCVLISFLCRHTDECCQGEIKPRKRMVYYGVGGGEVRACERYGDVEGRKSRVRRSPQRGSVSVMGVVLHPEGCGRKIYPCADVDFSDAGSTGFDHLWYEGWRQTLHECQVLSLTSNS
jgi:hypothetical protein